MIGDNRISEQYIKNNPVKTVVLDVDTFDKDWTLYYFIIDGGDFMELKGHYDNRSEWKNLAGIMKSINSENRRNIGCSFSGNYIQRAVILKHTYKRDDKTITRYTADIEYKGE